MKKIITYRLVVLGVFLWVALFWGNVTPTLAVEQPVTAPDKKEIPEELSPEEIKKKIVDLNERIDRAKQAENAQKARQMGVALTDLRERTAGLRSI